MKNHLIISLLILSVGCKTQKPIKDLTDWYENGQKKSEGSSTHGVKNGTWTWWYEYGQKSSERTWDEKEDGLLTYFYENGQKYLEKTYKDGKEISSKCWDKDGNECECGQYWWAGCK